MRGRVALEHEPDRITYTLLADLSTATEKARRDARHRCLRGVGLSAA
jgi:hypothetical protein